jgi:hypothetical protein
MSDRDHADAVRIVREINRLMGTEASFACVTLCALERLLDEVREAKETVEQPALPLGAVPAPKRWPSHIA